MEKNKKSNNLLEVRLQEETDRLNHAFNKCLENAAKIGNCNQPITITRDDTVFIKPTPPQSDWEKIETAGKRVHLLLYGGERENDPQYTEWRDDLESAISDWIDAWKEKVKEETQLTN